MTGRGPPDITGMTSLKVDCTGSPPEKWTIEELREVFEKYGEVGDVFIPREKYSERPRGFAFVRYYSEKDAKEAIKEMNGKKFDGTILTVSKANRSREEAFVTAKENGGSNEGAETGSPGALLEGAVEVVAVGVLNHAESARDPVRALDLADDARRRL
eukprot:CAMPEP_0169125236 /NCGR_PEP_ID=MMETSP1015-20121227/34771_1 /TAXON_ID=342587 /ORGANISM="Karlodinium micrum, Strain CCMP2283" /LENGTH=157 /DNA_ID=CAMNT_0009188747 /DNA_START=77 /DNA_END=551 /DNA_ORIENTATION=+